MEHGKSEQMPGEDGARKKTGFSTCAPDEHAPLNSFHSPLNKDHTRQTGNPGFDPLTPGNFGALHSNECKHGTEKAQTDSGNHQPPARLIVACRWKKWSEWVSPLQSFTITQRHSEVDSTTSTRIMHEIQQVVSKSELFFCTIRLCCDRPAVFATAEATLLTLTWLEDKLAPQQLTHDICQQWEQSRLRSSGNFPQLLSNSWEPRLDIDMFGGMWTVHAFYAWWVAMNFILKFYLEIEDEAGGFRSEAACSCKHTKQLKKKALQAMPCTSWWWQIEEWVTFYSEIRWQGAMNINPIK